MLYGYDVKGIKRLEARDRAEAERLTAAYFAEHPAAWWIDWNGYADDNARLFPSDVFRIKNKEAK